MHKPHLSLIGDNHLYLLAIEGLIKRKVAINNLSTNEFLKKEYIAEAQLVILLLESNSLENSRAISLMAKYHPRNTAICFNANAKAAALQAYESGIEHFISLDEPSKKLEKRLNQFIDHTDNANIDMLQSLSGMQSNAKVLYELSEQEHTIIQKIWNGHTNKEISDTMDLSERTIERYRSTMLKKTGKRNTISLIRESLNHGIIQLNKDN